MSCCYIEIFDTSMEEWRLDFRYLDFYWFFKEFCDFDMIDIIDLFEVILSKIENFKSTSIKAL